MKDDVTPTDQSFPKLGNKPRGEDLWQRYGADHDVWNKSMLTTLHGRKVRGKRWFSLIDKVGRMKTLEIAYGKVLSNAGACGVDGISVAAFDKDSHKRLLAVNEHIMKGTYQPEAIKRVYIPKAGSSSKRPLGIPIIRDRVVQGALKLVIEPIFEREFCDNSYGFRPNRGCRDALRQVEEHLGKGHLHVIDLDIQGYFDAIPHEKLLELVKERISDSKVLGLIKAFLKARVLESGRLSDETTQGSPQGGLISPLLANIYLNPLDWLLHGKGSRSVRYADDIVICMDDAESACTVLEEVRGWMEKAGLTLHPEKTRIVDMTQVDAYFDFLGYRFKRSKKGTLMRLIKPGSKKTLRAKLKGPTRRCNGHSMGVIIAQINITLKGWYGYFKHARLDELSAIDGWVRMRLRSILRKRMKKKGRGRGSDHQRWPNRSFEALGLFSLEAAKVREVSLLKGVKC